MEIHPIARIVPPLRPAEWKGLLAKVKAHGRPKVPVYLYGGEIIANLHIYHACMEAGVEPLMVEWDGRGQLSRTVLDMASQYRVLDKTDCAIMAVEVLPFMEAEARQAQCEAGRTCGKARSKVGADRPTAKEREENRAAAKAAKSTGSSRKQVQRLKRIKKVDSGLLDLVRTRKVTISAADEIAALPPDKRVRVTEDIAANGVKVAMTRHEGRAGPPDAVAALAAADRACVDLAFKLETALVKPPPPDEAGRPGRHGGDRAPDESHRPVCLACRGRSLRHRSCPPQRRRRGEMSTLIGACVREQRGLFRTHNESLRPDELLSSEDWKFGREGRSYNNPIYPSCRGMTPRCEEAPCYTVEPSSPLSFRNKQKKWIRNFNFVETHPFPEGVAEILADECDRHGLKFLRICGCGDLTAKLVAAVNALVELRPTRPIWVSTRIPELAAQLSRDAENLYLMVTSDASRRGRACWDRMKEENHPRAFNAFLMTRPDDEPGPEARVIFPARGVEGLPFIEGVTCPADHPAAPLDLKGACAKCGRCWGPGALDGSRHERPRQVATPPGAANSTTRKGPPKPVAGLKGTSPDAREDGASVREALALIHHLDGLVAGAGVAPESLQPLTDGIEVVQQRLAERLRKENTR